jgi:hypothetical protein
MNLLMKAIVAAGIVLAIGVGSTAVFLLTADSDAETSRTMVEPLGDGRDSGGSGLAMCAPDVPDCNDTIVLPGDITECVAREDGVDCVRPGEQKDVPDCFVVFPEGAAPEIDPAPESGDLPDDVPADLDARGHGLTGGGTEDCADLPPDCAVSSDGETACPERRPLFDGGGAGVSSPGSPGAADAVDPVEPLE